jgi:hypothetical protein
MSVDPFKGRANCATEPMRILYRFSKPGGHWAEIRERKVAPFRGLEFIVFVDGSLLESQMFFGERLTLYTIELDARVQQFLDGGWIAEAPKTSASS